MSEYIQLYKDAQATKPVYPYIDMTAVNNLEEKINNLEEKIQYKDVSIKTSSGTVVTLSNDDNTYTVISDGTAYFPSVALGTYTLTISRNGETASKIIEVKADVEDILGFRTKLYVEGDECTSTSGGWGSNIQSKTYSSNTSSYAAFTKNVSTIRMEYYISDSWDYENYAYAVSNNLIDLTNFTTLQVYGQVTGAANRGGFGICSNKDDVRNSCITAKSMSDITGWYEIDISNLDSGYIFAGVDCESVFNTSAKQAGDTATMWFSVIYLYG